MSDDTRRLDKRYKCPRPRSSSARVCLVALNVALRAADSPWHCHSTGLAQQAKSELEHQTNSLSLLNISLARRHRHTVSDQALLMRCPVTTHSRAIQFAVQEKRI